MRAAEALLFEAVDNKNVRRWPPGKGISMATAKKRDQIVRAWPEGKPPIPDREELDNYLFQTDFESPPAEELYIR